LGEAIGKLIETRVQEITETVVQPYGLVVNRGEIRLVNDTGNEYRLDTVVVDDSGKPIVLIESKYLRYKKHNRDKASWTCVAHFKLRTTYPTIKKSLAVLSGRWTESSRVLMNAFGVETILIPFEHLADTLLKYGVEFRWSEKDERIPRKALRAFYAIAQQEKARIGVQICEPIEGELRRKLVEAATVDETRAGAVEQVELLIRTVRGEYFVKRLSGVVETIRYLSGLVREMEDLSETLRRRGEGDS